jgi:hypothetical protein
MLFRFRYQVQGGHTHVRMFAGKSVPALGKCGDLVFRNEEWNEFLAELAPSFANRREGAAIDVLPEAVHGPWD